VARRQTAFCDAYDALIGLAAAGVEPEMVSSLSARLRQVLMINADGEVPDFDDLPPLPGPPTTQLEPGSPEDGWGEPICGTADPSRDRLLRSEAFMRGMDLRAERSLTRLYEKGDHQSRLLRETLAEAEHLAASLKR
jgi:hypothetical protein